MTNGVKQMISTDNQELENVTEFLDPGRLISFEEMQEKEIRRKTQNAWRAFWKLRIYLTSKNIEIQHRRRLFDMRILPVMTYGSTTWSLTKKQQELIRVAQRGMERRMMGITRCDRVRNKEIRRRTGVKDAINEASNLKWNWAGHIMRRPDKRWTKRVTEWQPRESERSRGRQ